MDKTISDKYIVEMITRREEKALREVFLHLYREHYPSVKRYIVMNNGSEESSADIFQEALVVFYLNVRKGQFELKSTIGTYLYSVSKNLWLKELQKSRTTLSRELGTEDNSLDQEMRVFESQITIRKVLGLIDLECRNLLIDFYFGNYPVKDLTRKYGLGSDGATKNKKYRCLQKLVKLVKQKKLNRTDFSYE